MTILFWNGAKKTNTNPLIINMILEHQCELVVLAEYGDNGNGLCNELSTYGVNFREIKGMGGCKKVRIFGKSTIGYECCFETSNYAIFHLTYAEIPMIIAALHLPSRMYDHDERKKENISRELASDIIKVEDALRHENTIVIGDFNANPFEYVLVGADCLHAIASRDIVTAKKERTVDDKRYKMFYNPMWNLFGDFESPDGTYYYEKDGLPAQFWHIFDQVLLRPSVARAFEDDSLKILHEVNGFSLLKNGRPDIDISDHLPIVFEICEEMLL